PVADAVLRFIRIVGVRWPEGILERFVRARPCIGVAHQNGDRGAERLTVEHAGKQLGAIGLVTRRRDLALPGAPPIEIALDLLERDRQTRRTAVDHHADAAAMRLAERGDAKEMAERGRHTAVKVSEVLQADKGRATAQCRDGSLRRQRMLPQKFPHPCGRLRRPGVTLVLLAVLDHGAVAAGAPARAGRAVGLRGCGGTAVDLQPIVARGARVVDRNELVDAAMLDENRYAAPGCTRDAQLAA